MKTQNPPHEVLRAAVDKLRIDGACMRIDSREATDAATARLLAAAAEKIYRTANALERLSYTGGKSEV